MNSSPSFFGWALRAGMLGLAWTVVAHAKPPVPTRGNQKVPPTPVAPTVSASEALPLLRWLLQQNGGTDAISVPWAEMVRAAADKQISPVDPANGADAAAIAKISASLDAILPAMNRPDSSICGGVIVTVQEVAARFASELQSALRAVPGLSTEKLLDPAFPDRAYPDFRLVEAASGRAYYLGVALYTTGERDAPIRALALHPTEAASRIKTDGCCLLVGVEHNGKPGREMTFLNWELIDLAKVPIRCSVVFEADQHAIHQPGCVLSDGRKGRD